MMQSKRATAVLVVLVAAAFASSSVNCNVADDIPTDYLDILSEPLQTKDTYEVLRKDARPAGLDPNKMLEQFVVQSKLEVNSLKTAWEHHFYLTMHKLGEKGNEACGTLMFERVIEIISIAKQQPESPAIANYINFLKTIGAAKFAECVAKIDSLFDMKLHGGMARYFETVKAERYLDEFYEAYSGSKKKLDERELYEVAKKVDFANGDFNVRKMVKIARDFALDAFGRADPAKELDPIIVLAQFQNEFCSLIQVDMDILLVMYNIAAALGSKLPSNVPVRFLKIREYRRICKAFYKDEEAHENIMRQLSAKKTYKTLPPGMHSRQHRYGSRQNIKYFLSRVELVRSTV